MADSRIHATGPGDLDRLAEFLGRVFQVGPDAHFLQRELLEWKYFVPRPDWPGSRSYVLERDSQILAHMGVSPAEVRAAGTRIACHVAIDWAADRVAGGAGIALLRKMRALTDLTWCFGGSAATRAILPRIGFGPVAEVRTYSKCLRPWKEFACRERSWKSALRMVREFGNYSLEVRSGSWAAEALARFDDSLEPLLNAGPPGFTSFYRTAEILNYMLDCPTVSFSGHLLRKNGTPRGYFLLSEVAGLVRIADIRIASKDPSEWRGGYAAATQAAMERPGVCRITAASSAPVLSEALEGNGYLLARRSPLMVCDPRKLLAGLPPLNIQLFEGDAAYYSE